MNPEPSPFVVNGKTAVCRLRLQRAEWEGEGALCELPGRAITEWEPRAAAILSEPEQAYYRRVPAERRRKSFLLGRVAARLALSELSAVPPATQWRAWHGTEVISGVFQEPVLGRGVAPGYGLSIAHTGELVLAVAFPAGHPMAVDVETIAAARAQAVTSQLTAEERSMIETGDRSQSALRFALWSAREALSKVLRCGLVCSPEVLAVKQIAVDRNRAAGTFRHFPQYRFVAELGDVFVRALVLPRQTRLTTAIPAAPG